MRFLYESRVGLTEKFALVLYEMAVIYQQRDLLKLCEEFLCKIIWSDNIISTIEFEEQFQAEAFKESVLGLIGKI